MGVHDFAQLLAALGAGSFLPSICKTLWRRVNKDPKLAAEARKLNADASRTEWRTLRDEIDRLTTTVRAQGRCIAQLEAQAEERVARETSLELENKRLHAEVGRLRRRVHDLESILKVAPLPDDMREQLKELDHKTGGKR